jgi:hypothetical protein
MCYSVPQYLSLFSMYKLYFIALLTMTVSCRSASKVTRLKTIPQDLLGNFKDDYDIRYSISDSVWIQHPGIKYHLISYNKEEQYFIALNAATNPSEAGLYSRIDIMYFENMEPFRWGFCLTAYKATTKEEAIATTAADRSNPRKGCGGFPFSRMKKD